MASKGAGRAGQRRDVGPPHGLRGRSLVDLVHPAVRWRVLFLLCRSGTMLAAGLDRGASKVIEIDREEKYLATARARVEAG